MIRAKVALSTGARLSGNRHRTGVTRVAGGAVTDCAVIVRLADTVTLIASACHCRWSLESCERMWWTFDSSRLVGLGKIHLFRSKCFVSAYRSPRYGSVATAQKLLINILVTAPTVACGQTADNGESVVVFAFLSICRLMAIEAIDSFLRVLAHFVFMDDRILRTRVAIGTLSRSTHEFRFWLLSLNAGTCAVDQKCGKHQCEGN